MVGQVMDVINRTKFCENRSSGFRATRPRKTAFPIDSVRRLGILVSVQLYTMRNTPVSVAHSHGQLYFFSTGQINALVGIQSLRRSARSAFSSNMWSTFSSFGIQDQSRQLQPVHR